MHTPLTHRLLPAALGCGLAVAIGLAVGCTPDPAPGAGPDQGAMITPTTKPSPTSSASPGSNHPMSISYASDIAPLLKTSCASCHGTTASGGVSLFDGSGNPKYTNIKSGIMKIIDEVSSGSMPRGGQRFTQAQIDMLEMWEMEGTPNN